MSEQAQQKLPPLALLKLGKQVQSGGPGGGGPISRSKGMGEGRRGHGTGVGGSKGMG